MTNLPGVVRHLKKERVRLTRQIKGVAAALAAFGAAYGKGTGRRKISAAGRARIAAAQRARWAKVKSAGPKKRTSKTAAHRERRRLTNTKVKSTSEKL